MGALATAKEKAVADDYRTMALWSWHLESTSTCNNNLDLKASRSLIFCKMVPVDGLLELHETDKGTSHAQCTSTPLVTGTR